MRVNAGDPIGEAAVKDAIQDGEQKLADNGRILIRKSGTEPLIRVMAEGEDEALVETVVDRIVAEIEKSTAA